MLLFITACAAARPQVSTAQRGPITPLSITEAGVGPITGSTPADVGQIAKLLPQFSVIRGVRYSEGDPYPVIRIMDGKTEVFHIVPDREPAPGAKIHAIVVESNRVSYAGKVRVGSTFAEIFGNTLPADCSMGMEESSFNVVCDAVPKGRARFEFSGRSDRQDGRMPSLATLLKWRLATMWVLLDVLPNTPLQPTSGERVGVE
jgi:hypothetical protein